MKQVKVKTLIYQRNGVHGEPFYHCLARMKDDGVNMLITFRTKDDDKVIDWTTCRAVNLDDLKTAWRGDVIAGKLQHYFDNEMKNNGGTIYDCADSKTYSI